MSGWWCRRQKRSEINLKITIRSGVAVDTATLVCAGAESNATPGERGAVAAGLTAKLTARDSLEPTRHQGVSFASALTFATYFYGMHGSSVAILPRPDTIDGRGVGSVPRCGVRAIVFS